MFFISFVLITNYLLINLFLLIILQQFESLFVTIINPVELFTNITRFKMAWARYSQLINKSEINLYKIVDFERRLEPPLGDHTKNIIKRKFYNN